MKGRSPCGGPTGTSPGKERRRTTRTPIPVIAQDGKRWRGSKPNSSTGKPGAMLGEDITSRSSKVDEHSSVWSGTGKLVATLSADGAAMGFLRSHYYPSCVVHAPANIVFHSLLPGLVGTRLCGMVRIKGLEFMRVVLEVSLPLHVTILST